MAQHSFNQTSPSAGAGTSPFNLDFRQILLAIRERWLGALTLCLAAVSIMVWVQLRIPEQFESHASLAFVPPNQSLSIPSITDQRRGRLNGFLLSNYLIQITSREMVDLVEESLAPEERELVLLHNTVRSAEGIVTTPAVSNVLRQAVRARNIEQSLTLRITARHRSPEAAALIANRFAELYLVYLASQDATSDSSAIQFLERQARELSDKLERTEQDLQSYREGFNLVSLEEKQNVVLDRLKALSSSVTGARVSRIAIESRLKQVELLLKDGVSSQEIASLAQHSGLGASQQRIYELEAEYAVMSQKYGRRHPRMLDNRRQVEALVSLSEQQSENALAELGNQLRNAIAHEQQLAEELALSEAENLELDKIGVRYNVLRREVDTTRATYTQILTRLNETRISAQLDSEVFRMNERAFPIRTPVVPDKTKIMSSAVMLGLVLLIGYPVAMELIASKIRSWSDIEGALGSKLLGELSNYRKIAPEDRARILLKDVDSEAKESLRALYSQLKLTSDVPHPKVILVTSSIPGEGKSFIAANLAAAFSTHKFNTLLIDGDFRRPVQHKLWGLQNKHGILNWVDSEESVGEIGANVELGTSTIASNLSFIAAGGTTRNMTELMEPKGRLRELLQTAKKQFDTVIIDTPPAGVFPDAIALADCVDELIFVTRFNAVTRQHARQVLQTLAKTGMSMPGVVLNGMPSGKSGALYYSNYGYNYHGSKYREKYQS